LRCCLPVQSEDKARRRMAIRSRMPPFRKRRIQKVELIGLPNFLFQVDIHDRRFSRTVPVAVEAVTGSVSVLGDQAGFADAYDLELLPGVLSENQARDRVMVHYRWVLLGAGLKQRRRYRVGEVRPEGSFAYPYWVAYYLCGGSGGKWDFDAMDAITGMLQGPSMRRVILTGMCLKEGGGRLAEG